MIDIIYVYMGKSYRILLKTWSLSQPTETVWFVDPFWFGLDVDIVCTERGPAVGTIFSDKPRSCCTDAPTGCEP